jgi:hypothetical protein
MATHENIARALKARLSELTSRVAEFEALVVLLAFIPLILWLIDRCDKIEIEH